MRFLLDQDVYTVTARFLIDAGHDVVLVAQIGLSQASDEEILKTAQGQNRILLTRDRTELLNAGVPQSDIVLAFHPPSERALTEFATN